MPEPFHHGDLVRGQHLGFDFPDAKLGSHRARGCRVVAGEHEKAYAGGPQGGDRTGGSAFDRIGNGEHSSGRSINCDEDDRRAVLAKLISFAGKATEFHVRLAQHARVTDHQAVPVKRTGHTFAYRCIEAVDVGKSDLALLRRLHHGRPERVLAVAL